MLKCIFNYLGNKFEEKKIKLIIYIYICLSFLIIINIFSDDFKSTRQILNPSLMNPNAPNDCEIVVTNNSLT